MCVVFLCFLPPCSGWMVHGAFHRSTLYLFSLCFCRVTTTPVKPKSFTSVWTQQAWPSSSGKKSSNNSRRSVKGWGSWSGCWKEEAPSLITLRGLEACIRRKKLQVHFWFLVTKSLFPLCRHSVAVQTDNTPSQVNWGPCTSFGGWGGQIRIRIGRHQRKWAWGSSTVMVWWRGCLVRINNNNTWYLHMMNEAWTKWPCLDSADSGQRGNISLFSGLGWALEVLWTAGNNSPCCGETSGGNLFRPGLKQINIVYQCIWAPLITAKFNMPWK